MMADNYGKRPLWQWIVLSIIIGAIACGLIYYFFFYKNGRGYTAQNYQNNNSNQNQMQTTNQTSTSYDVQGMHIDVLTQGTGEAAKSGDMVTVNYTGTLMDGTKFDSSLNPGRTPFQFTLGQNRVIQGWELGVLGMKVGEKRKLTIPGELGYGAQGSGYGGKFGCSGQPNCDPNKETYIIPPNATLTFEVDLLKIN